METSMKCKRCGADVRDGVKCSACQGHFDFPCSGITEAGYRKLGDRKATWRCPSCKGNASPLPAGGPADLDSISRDLKQLTLQMAALPILAASVKAIQEDIADLKALKSDIADLKLLKPDIAELKASVEFVQNTYESLTGRVTTLNNEVQSLHKTKELVQKLEQHYDRMVFNISDLEQRARMNNIEIKGVPLSNNENLFVVIDKIGKHINCTLPKEQINYIARIPSRNDNKKKNILVSVLNRYIKEDFVAAAKKITTVPADLDLQGESRIYVNDHLTLENKLLLNKAKTLAKERGFAYTWVRGCKIFLRKSPTSHVINIKGEADLKKIT